jgi:hypothetical protein
MAIKQIQQAYKENYEQKSIAQELIQNSLNEKQYGNISISNNLILLQIQNIKEEEATDIVAKINEGLIAARECYHNKEKRLASLEMQRKNLKSHGRGFLTIFYFGWDVVTLKNKGQVLIAAIKH